MLTAVYDLASSPPTFDFVSFLVSAELERLKQGKAHIRLLIAAGPDNGFRRDRLPPRDPAERRRMLENIVLPMASLLPSVVAVEQRQAHEISQADFPRGWSQKNRCNHYGTQHQVAAYRAGCFPLTAHVTERDSRLVTITLRESEYWPTRNSNVRAWETLAATLRVLGATVRVIRGNDLPNAYERAKVYERARLNCFINNGPAWMATFMSAPCLIFKMCSEGAVCVDRRFFAAVGFPEGSQVGRPGHRIVWADDDLPTITQAAFDALETEYAHG